MTTLSPPLIPPVLNPTVRLSWIESEWETTFIENAKKTIKKIVSTILGPLTPFSQLSVAQMTRYHDKKLSTAATTAPSNPVRPAPVARYEASPTRFTVEHSAFAKRLSHPLTVDAEFRKYAMGDISSPETNILRFWEVSHSDLTSLRSDSHHK